MKKNNTLLLSTAKKISLGTVFLYLFINKTNAQFISKDKLSIAEFELAYSPDKREFMFNTNGLAKVDLFNARLSWFYEHNFNHKLNDYSFAFDPKVFGPLHASFSFENDIFGIHPNKSHFQQGVKFYLQDVDFFSHPFLNLSVGANYSLFGNAEHRVGDFELTYSFLTNPLWIRKELGLVFQSSARIREGHDFMIFQLGVEYPKMNSVFMLGTGQVYDGEVEFFLGIQYSLVPNHKSFSFH
jgi:hypothetical protein